ncbi:hypothetical protein GM921_03180 [Pedobacter sp. LMG 31464]|uniref:Colicin import membrane protein n=1 Tax=Pedobacter planticolens TaxID=2679964 RepID=A0A923DX83_9SPHI|nr:hypothetical protein [Pedobacter planticolens]MBB2144473.1 hypothetical protein [Pedobacter planticolens]
MKKIISILGSLLLMTAVKAQTTVVKKETVNPGSSQTTGTSTPAKDPKAAGYDPKKEAADKLAAERAAKDAKTAQHVDTKIPPAKEPKAAGYDPKKEAADKLAAERAAKDAKIANQVDPKKEAEAKAAAERAAKDAKIANQVDPKKEAEAKAAAERAIKDAKILHKGK